jgi:diaminopimelate decarboxylase
VVGPICSPSDTLYEVWRGPELSEGDTVVIMDAGAYFVPFSNAFSFPRPAIVMLDHGQVSLLRRAERFEDLVAYDEAPTTGVGSRTTATTDATSLPFVAD